MTIRQGFSFNGLVVVAGVLLSIFGLFLIFIIGDLIGLVALFIGVFLWSSSYGAQINLEQKKCREYGQLFWLKKGKWENLDRYPYLAVTKSKVGIKLTSIGGNPSRHSGNDFIVCLISESHRKKWK